MGNNAEMWTDQKLAFSPLCRDKWLGSILLDQKMWNAPIEVQGFEPHPGVNLC